jgi:hypothetical protein
VGEDGRVDKHKPRGWCLCLTARPRGGEGGLPPPHPPPAPPLTHPRTFRLANAAMARSECKSEGEDRLLVFALATSNSCSARRRLSRPLSRSGEFPPVSMGEGDLI